MKRRLAVRGAILVVALAALAGGSQLVNVTLTSGDGGPPEDKVAKGRLAAEDLNTDGEAGWTELATAPPVTRADKAKPRVSSAVFVGQFVCDKADPEPDEVVDFVPVATEDRKITAAFRRKDDAGSPGKARGLSKLLSQRMADFSNDGGGGMTGAEKAKAVLEQIRAIVENPACESIQWRTQDPASADNPGGAQRVWQIVPQPELDLGDTPGPGEKKNAVHFRALTTIAGPPDPNLPGATPEAVMIENDIIVIRRGHVLMVLIETSPGGHPNAAEEAKGRAGKADNKIKNSMAS